ncbi:hypothetical protein HK100_002134 [Physocladia obscura]|uniref:Uncharacterized protein n=1 Tax=Physocladia obscura TaxID=109957 RepID=A0AAD5XEE3_9FUNG|nr:hypothetical protein HK100_002134 [Physocladia obscura]
MHEIAVIGTAGRGNTAVLTSESLFGAIVAKAEDIVTNEWEFDWGQVHLISGGAAWTDHAAIRLFLAHPSAKLTLHFPCQFIVGPKPQFEDLGSTDWRKNSGQMANQYHKQFSSVINSNSMLEILEAIEAGAVVATDSRGFHDCNTKIALAQRMIAFTWSKGISPEKGGTLDT